MSESERNKFRAQARIRSIPQKGLDDVREALDLSRERAEEISFVSSAISIPQKGLCFGVTIVAVTKPSVFWQLTSVVVEDGEVSHTANFCQQCYNIKSWSRREVHL